MNPWYTKGVYINILDVKNCLSLSSGQKEGRTGYGLYSLIAYAVLICLLPAGDPYY